MVIKGDLKAKNWNEVYYDEKSKIVYKKYRLMNDFEREIKALDFYSSLLNVPKIMNIYEDERVLSYRFIPGRSLASLETIIDHFDKIKHALNIIWANKMDSYLINKNLKKLLYELKHFKREKYYSIKNELKNLRINYIIKAFKPKKDTYTHGDFRTHNLIISGDSELYVIDWELCGVGDKNVDLAYLFMSLKSDDVKSFLEFFKDDIDFDNFLYFCTFYSIAAFLNPRNKKHFSHYLKRLEEII